MNDLNEFMAADLPVRALFVLSRAPEGMALTPLASMLAVTRDVMSIALFRLVERGMIRRTFNGQWSSWHVACRKCGHPGGRERGDSDPTAT